MNISSIKLAIITLVFLPVLTFAQSDCGDFVEVEIDDGETFEYRTPIEDCDNPFNADDPEPFTYELLINDKKVTSGDSIKIRPESSTTISATMDLINPSGGSPLRDINLFRASGTDYYRLNNFGVRNAAGNINVTESGEYVAVLTYDELSFSQSPTWLDQVKGFFLPGTALAFFPDFSNVVIVNFSVEIELVANDCGNILSLEGESVVIIDCDDPFGVSAFEAIDLKLSVLGQSLVDEASILVPAMTAVPFSYSVVETRPNSGTFANSLFELYRVNENGYELKHQSEHFENLSQNILLTELETGDYVAVIRYTERGIEKSESEDFFGAQVVTFSIQTEVVEPPPATGASSVLFLPGIMGSRLYEEIDACEITGVQERWFSRDACEQLRLTTSFTGQSTNNIYTTTDDSSVISEILGFNLYKSFLRELNDLESNETIKDFVPMAYDWRLQLDDILKSTELNGEVRGGKASSVSEGYMHKVVSEMVNESHSGKVTIVTHSNGGLVAKAFLAALESANDPLLEQIDNLILVGVPQTGTPESVISLLHGSEIGPSGVVLGNQTTRALVNTMPFIHHLLPSENYFSNQSVDPVIRISPGPATDGLRNQFGAAITTKDALHEFLSTASGRQKPAAEDLATPEVSDPFLLNYASTAHQIQSNWTPPDTLQVTQVAGVGIQTPVAITYFSDEECVARNPLKLFRCTEKRAKLGTKITSSPEGDGTVVGSSAGSMSVGPIRTLWLDLDNYDVFNLVRVHKDIFEVPDVYDLVTNTIGITDATSYEYMATNRPDLSSIANTVIQLHSPLDMILKSSVGELSSTTNTIEGGYYERFGETQYISVPTGTPDLQLVLIGQAFGSFTLEIENWEGTEIAHQIIFSGIPSDVGTIVTLSPSDDLQTDSLIIDYEGDGILDIEVFSDETIIELVEPEIIDSPDTQPEINQEDAIATGGSSSGTRIQPQGQVAGAAVTGDPYLQELYILLKELGRLLDLLEKNSI